MTQRIFIKLNNQMTGLKLLGVVQHRVQQGWLTPEVMLGLDLPNISAVGTRVNHLCHECPFVSLTLARRKCLRASVSHTLVANN